MIEKPTNSEKPRGMLAIQTIAMPRETNANGDIFGGWLVSQMDLAGGVLAHKISQGRTVTIAIDSMIFKRPVHVGDTLSCYVDLIKRGRTSMTLHVEAWCLRQLTAQFEQVTEGQFTFVAIDEAGRPRALK